VTRCFGGTGLGLAISKQLSEAMGGGISVRSQVDVGTLFTIRIDPGPLQEVDWITAADLTRPRSTTACETLETTRFGPAHILVVDDAEANRDLTAVMLDRIGLTCDKAVNGQDALERIAQTRYDVVLMDINMPVMDGLTATSRLRAAGNDIPVLALTALAIEEEKQRCLQAGCNGFLAKPIRLPSLVEALIPWLASGGEPDLQTEQPRDTQPPAVTADREPRAGCEVSAVDSSLHQTPANHSGSGQSNQQADGTAGGQGDLHLPDVVHSSLPLDEVLREIVESFVCRLNERLPEFRQAFESRNQRELRDLGHWLAGSAGTMGLDEFVAPARELEYSDGSDRERQRVLLNHIAELTRRIEVPVPG
jgi:CheY-like chemotaxis protein